MSTTTINIRVDENVKKEIDDIFDNLGLNTSSAVNMFFRQVIISEAIPFPIKLNRRHKTLNEYDIKQILEVLKMTDLATMLIENTVIEIVKKAIKENLPLDIIAKLTNLDIDTIKAIQEQDSEQSDD